jgi:hypothetical protein
MNSRDASLCGWRWGWSGLLVLPILSATPVWAADPPVWSGHDLDGYWQRPVLEGETLPSLIQKEYPQNPKLWQPLLDYLYEENPLLPRQKVPAGTLLKLPVYSARGKGKFLETMSRQYTTPEPLVGNLEASGGGSGLEVVDSRGQNRKVGNGQSVYRGDRVSTAAQVTARIRLLDGTAVLIRPSSTIEIKEFQLQNERSTGKSTIKLVSGAMRAISGMLSKGPGSEAKVETPVALIGIRGTDYGVRYCPEGACVLTGKVFESGTYSGVLSGAITVDNGSGAARLGAGDVFGALPDLAPMPRPDALFLLFTPPEIAESGVRFNNPCFTHPKIPHTLVCGLSK